MNYRPLLFHFIKKSNEIIIIQLKSMKLLIFNIKRYQCVKHELSDKCKSFYTMKKAMSLAIRQ